MKTRFRFPVAISTALFLAIIFAANALAATFQVSGRVTDQSGSPLADTLVSIINPGSGSTIASASTDSNGAYSLSVDEGTYNIRVTPPAGSGLGSAVALNQTIDGPKEIDFVLVPEGTAMLSGRLLNLFGDPLPDQRISLAPEGTTNYIDVFTAADGSFSFDVAPGNYYVRFENYSSPDKNVPTAYYLVSQPFSLDANLTVDLTLPFRRIQVHVQDPTGSPVSAVKLNTSNPGLFSGELAPGITINYGSSYYPVWQPPATTDAAGDASLWLFPAGNPYTFTITPPANSPFVVFSIEDITVSEHKDIIVVLQFAHAPPVTTAALTPPINAAGEHPDPTAVTLSAAAAPGFSIAATYYRVDGGAQQTYTGPFTVSGGGAHSLEFWSVDDFGVFEIPQFLDFNIVINQPPLADANGPYTLEEGSGVLLDASSSTDPDNNIALYEWDFDNDGVYDATGETTWAAFSDDGSYTVSLRVTDDYGESDSDTAEVIVSNVAPEVNVITTLADPVQLGAQIDVSGTFSDPGADVWTATWSWGDGSSSTGTITEFDVSGSHIYTTPGVYELVLTIDDGDGGIGSAEYQYLVVFDPSGGFVTGGGWVWSPGGAYAPDPTLEGKASFGFVAKYKKGAQIPTGVTEFQFRMADLNFHSDTYHWLVVAGARAQFKGVGTINGLGQYGFMLTATDGQLNGGGGVDRFRIKIWDITNDTVIYDNQIGEDDTAELTMDLGGGSIVIHKGK